MKNPYGNHEIIDNFMKNLCTELEGVGDQVKKKVKPNPSPDKELNVLSAESKSVKSEYYKSPTTYVNVTK